MSEDWSKKVGQQTLRVVLYVILLAATLVGLSLAFAKIVAFKAYGEYLSYIQGGFVVLIGYKMVSHLSGAVYYSMRKVTDHSTAAATRTITRIAGAAVLLSFLASIFGVNASSALTIGSFSGLVVGFATQTVLTHAIAGIFIAISHPFKHGDLVTIEGHTGLVKEITLMHTTLKSKEDSREILIPSGKIIGGIIIKRVQA